MSAGTAQKSPQPSAALGGDLVERMGAGNLAPLWNIYKDLVRPEPRPSEPSQLWRWRDLLPLAEAAARQVTGELADHRVLLLRNPALEGPVHTTTRLIAGVQCVLPGERTIEHRHTASACRLILEGEGATTLVDGRRCPMHARDFIITPNWTWHGHDNGTASRAIWLDMLDVPFVGAMNAGFGGAGPATSYPEHVARYAEAVIDRGGLRPAGPPPDVPYSLRFRWSWPEIAAALADAPAAPDGTRRVDFTDPLTGRALMPTLAASVVAVAADRPSRAMRTTATGLCVVLDGEGESTVGAVQHRWGPRDIFTLPAWQWISHRSLGGEAKLLIVSDAEALRRLAWLREDIET